MILETALPYISHRAMILVLQCFFDESTKHRLFESLQDNELLVSSMLDIGERLATLELKVKQSSIQDESNEQDGIALNQTPA